jgi:hypothetical protein
VVLPRGTLPRCSGGAAEILRAAPERAQGLSNLLTLSATVKRNMVSLNEVGQGFERAVGVWVSFHEQMQAQHRHQQPQQQQAAIEPRAE